mmetsp:Transcript_28932/g.91248  ORF Transcript_28932/g.91248 Transcript_28932/m.91248 type:complete len:104 (-) Transcript_28932:176-487(-)
MAVALLEHKCGPHHEDWQYADEIVRISGLDGDAAVNIRPLVIRVAKSMSWREVELYVDSYINEERAWGAELRAWLPWAPSPGSSGGAARARADDESCAAILDD